MATSTQPNAVAAALPMRVADIVSELLSGQWRPMMSEFKSWWDGFASPLFAALVKAGVAPDTAIALIFSDNFPKPGTVQEMTLEMVGSTTVIVENKTDRSLTVSLGYTGIVTAALGGSFSSSNSNSQTQQAQSTLTLKVGPAAAPSFTAQMLAALAQAGMPDLPAVPLTVPAPALTSGTKPPGG